VVPGWIYLLPHVKPRHCLLFAALKSFTDGDTPNECWPSQATLAARIGKPATKHVLRDVRRSLAEMRKLGLVRMKQRDRTSSLYQLAGAGPFEVTDEASDIAVEADR
jgi:hypothetical protein